MSPIKLIECPRDAMQGLSDFIPTTSKIHYINLLLQVGFDTIDFGSFVSPKAIPQMQDTAEVLFGLQTRASYSKLLAIVANRRGAEAAVRHEKITYLGFPLSASETFQQRNTNKTIGQALEEIAEMWALCKQYGKTLVVYISMGFGNPYGDPWSPENIRNLVEKLNQMGINSISLADTVGVANSEDVFSLFSELIPNFPHIEFGAHLHARPDAYEEKLEAAFSAGCRRFDGALKGFGGCPMATDNLVGNMATENILAFLEKKGINLNLNTAKLHEATAFALKIFH